MRKILLSILVVAIILMGCTPPIQEKQEMVAIYMHSTTDTNIRYIIMVQKKQELIAIHNLTGNIRIFTDVPPESNMWYEAVYEPDWNFRSNVIIHVHSAKDINMGKEIKAADLEKKE